MPRRKEEIGALLAQNPNREIFLAELKKTRGLRVSDEPERFSFEERGRLVRTAEWLFNEKNGDEHAQKRRDVEAGMRHLVGVPIHALIGIIDGLIDSATVLAGEVLEDATFFVSYSGKRMVDGWNRGKRGGTGR